MKAYKIFDHNWKCKDFQFEVGKEYTYEGKLEICESGFHACLKLEDCFKYYKAVSWNKIAEVEILGKSITHDEDSKIVTDKIKIVREIGWQELEEVYNDIYGASNISGGNNIWGASNISGGSNIRGGNYIYGASNIRGGNNINGGNYINGGSNIRGGSYIWGASNIRGGNDIWGAKNCYGVDSAIFIANKKRQPTIFGKKVTQKRFDEVFQKLNSFNWYPKFNNAFDFYLQKANDWEKVPADLIAPKTNKEAWADIPVPMKNYISSLKEYDKKTFKEITEIDLPKNSNLIFFLKMR